MASVIRRLAAAPIILLAAYLLMPSVALAATGTFSSASSVTALAARNTGSGRALDVRSAGSNTAQVVSDAASGSGAALYAVQRSRSAGAKAIWGVSTSSAAGSRYGVLGTAAGTNAYGVFSQGNLGIATGKALVCAGCVGESDLAFDPATQAELESSVPPARYLPAAEVATLADPGAGIGWDTSTTIGSDGMPVVSYYDDTDDDLKILHCGEITCSSGNTAIVADSTGNVGRYSSIAIGGDGLPVVSYYDATNQDLKVLHCGTMSCGSGNVVTTVDATGDVGRWTSIAVASDGSTVISYYDGTGADLRFLRCGNAACSTVSFTVALDTTGAVGPFTSMMVGADGKPVIAYLDDTNSDLKVLHCNNELCGGGCSVNVCGEPATTTVVEASSTPRDISMTIGDDGLPIVAYHDDAAGDLEVVHCGNLTCTAGNTTVVLDETTSDVGGYASITIGADGLPLVAYTDTAQLWLAHCGDRSCGSVSRSRVDAMASDGFFASVTIGVDGLPVIANIAGEVPGLRVVHCANPFCVPFFRRR